VLEHLKLGLSIYQVMNKHKCRVKEMMENSNELSRYLFLSEQNIIHLARKLAKKTYKKHENDAHSVRMWVVENKDKVFFYQESGQHVQGNLENNQLPFTVGIQTEWQRQMMLRHGHEIGISIDVTF
jgi:hypothetical protein